MKSPHRRKKKDAEQILPKRDPPNSPPTEVLRIMRVIIAMIEKTKKRSKMKVVSSVSYSPT
jgi:hypothetical protein